MGTNGNWQGQWEGDWHGAGDAPEGNLAGACSFAFSASASLEFIAAVGGGKFRKKRHFAKINGVRMLFATAELRDRALEAENAVEIATAAIEKAVVSSKPTKPVQQLIPRLIVPPVIAKTVTYDDTDEEDIEMLLISL